MLLISKSKVILLFLALLILTACAGGPKTRVLGEGPKLHNKGINKLSVIKDDSLGTISDDIANKDKGTSVVQDINHRLPIFILTGSLNSLSSVYGQSICDDLNNDFLNNQYICIIQPLSNLQDAKKYLKKDDLTSNPSAPFTADFLITRTDYLIEKQKNNTGPLKDFPTLDVVMFLNGSYLYLWGDPNYKSIEFSHFVDNFTKSNSSGRRVVIAVVTPYAKQLLTKVILANKWKTNFEFITLDPNNPIISKDLNFDIIAYAGATISQGMKDYINRYRKAFTPLSLSDELITNTQKSNPEISTTNISYYYDNSDLTNITKVIASLDNNSTSKATIDSEKHHAANNTAITDKQKNVPKTDYDKNDNSNKNDKLPPFVNKVKYGPGYDKYVFGKSKFDFNIKSVDEILEVDKIEDTRQIKVNSIGVRNVLVATRTTSPLKVFNLMSSFLSKYDFMKVNYPTGDMRNFNVSSLILGSLYDTSLIYHYGVINYVTYAKDGDDDRVSGKEAETINVISRYLTAKNTPPFYGPSMPNGSQISVINVEAHKRIVMRQQEEALQGLNSVIEDIKKELVAQTISNSGDLNPGSKEILIDLDELTASIQDSNITSSQTASKENTKPFSLEIPTIDIINNFNANISNITKPNNIKSESVNTITELPEELKALLPISDKQAGINSTNNLLGISSSDAATSASANNDNANTSVATKSTSEVAPSTNETISPMSLSLSDNNILNSGIVLPTNSQ